MGKNKNVTQGLPGVKDVQDFRVGSMYKSQTEKKEEIRKKSPSLYSHQHDSEIKRFYLYIHSLNST